MKQTAIAAGARRPAGSMLNPGIDTRHLGLTLRSLYEGSIDTLPIPDSQVELLLRLRQKEREQRRPA